MKSEFKLSIKELKSLSSLFSKLVELRANAVNMYTRVDIFHYTYNEAVKKYNKLPDVTKQTPYSISKSILESEIDKSTAEHIASVPLKEGDAVAYRVRISQATGKATYSVAGAMPIFPGGENIVKSLAKKAISRDGYFAIGVQKGGSKVITVYHNTVRDIEKKDSNGIPVFKDGKPVIEKQIVAVKVSSMIRRYSSTETAFKQGIITGLNKVV